MILLSFHLIQAAIKLKLHLLSILMASRYINVGIYLDLKLYRKRVAGPVLKHVS